MTTDAPDAARSYDQPSAIQFSETGILHMTIPQLPEIAEAVAAVADHIETECEKLTRVNTEQAGEIERLRAWIHYAARSPSTAFMESQKVVQFLRHENTRLERLNKEERTTSEALGNLIDRLARALNEATLANCSAENARLLAEAREVEE